MLSGIKNIPISTLAPRSLSRPPFWVLVRRMKKKWMEKALPKTYSSSLNVLMVGCSSLVNLRLPGFFELTWYCRMFLHATSIESINRISLKGFQEHFAPQRPKQPSIYSSRTPTALRVFVRRLLRRFHVIDAVSGLDFLVAVVLLDRVQELYSQVLASWNGKIGPGWHSAGSRWTLSRAYLHISLAIGQPRRPIPELFEWSWPKPQTKWTRQIWQPFWILSLFLDSWVLQFWIEIL